MSSSEPVLPPPTFGGFLRQGLPVSTTDLAETTAISKGGAIFPGLPLESPTQVFASREGMFSAAFTLLSASKPQAV
ncbi:MAG: hypothetical protein ABEI06_02890, partial [Halobacteriaceae archaeon]